MIDERYFTRNRRNEAHYSGVFRQLQIIICLPGIHEYTFPLNLREYVLRSLERNGIKTNMSPDYCMQHDNHPISRKDLLCMLQHRASYCGMSFTELENCPAQHRMVFLTLTYCVSNGI